MKKMCSAAEKSWNRMKQGTDRYDRGRRKGGIFARDGGSGQTEEQPVRECADVFQNAHYSTWPIHYPDNIHYLLTRPLFMTANLWMQH